MSVLNQEITNKFILSEKYKRNLIFLKNYKIFCLWRGGWYEFLKDDEVKTLIYEFMEEEYPNKNISTALVNDLLNQIRWKIVEKRDQEDKNYICLKDMVFNLNTFEFEEHDRKKTVTYYFPYNSTDLVQATPHFSNFLKTSLVKEIDPYNKEIHTDQELINLIQEMIGYFLLDKMGAATFFLVGDGANGKSVLANVITEMIGRKFCSSMNIETLTSERFSTSYLIGKRLNISNEEESRFMKSDKFKALVTGEQITAEKKGGEHFELIPTTKYLFASNEIPTFSSINHGLIRRIKIIPFHRRFKESEQDKYLTEKLLTELPGIMGWAIDGAKRLVENGYVFSKSIASQVQIEEFENEISSAVRFIRENYDVNPSLDYFTSNDDLYNEYQEWCTVNGKKPINKISFCRDIVKNIEGVHNKRSGNIKGKNIAKKEELNLNEIDFNE